MRLITLYCLCLLSTVASAQPLISPAGDIAVDVRFGEEVDLVITMNGSSVLRVEQVDLFVDGVAQLDEVKGSRDRRNDTEIRPVVPVKSASISARYNEREVSFASGATLLVRVYDQGVAYRIVSGRTGKVTGEQLSLHFSEEAEVFWPQEESFYSHNERAYRRATVEELAGTLASTPVLVRSEEGAHIWVSESDLRAYPGMWLNAEANRLVGNWSTVPQDITDVNDRTELIFARHSYMTEIRAGEATPWRLIGIAKSGAELLQNQLVALTAQEPEGDFSWVRPGLVAWDWYNANNLYDVDFKAGINTETYLNYIDFASANGLEYIVLDEGWSPTTEVTISVPEIDLPKIIAYGAEKGVGVILWVLWKPFVSDLENTCRLYQSWGVKGVKVDFMQRDDRKMVDLYWEMARVTATNRLLLDLHGAYKPAGLHQTYPNVITREGVKGLEWYKFGNPGSGVGPEHDCTLPFTRMVAGPMDFTPGSMRNAQPTNHGYFFDRPMSLGTRAHQAALYVIYESPLQMLADSPSAYRKEPRFTRYIAQMPTVWENTVGLAGEVGDFVAIARETKAGDWYIGAITDTLARDISLPTHFLPEGNWYMEILRDGPNAARHAEDYRITTGMIEAGEPLEISLAPGGGWVARMKRR